MTCVRLSLRFSTTLDRIYENFVVVPVEKTANNVILIFKRFYASVITKDLGLGNNDKANTYKKINDLSYNHILNKNISDLSSKFRIENVSTKRHALPNMYWLSKMPKVPNKPRFIMASVKSSIKPLSQAITSAFRIFYRRIESYNNKYRFFAGVNAIWVVQTNKRVLKTINKFNSRNTAKSINTLTF